MVLNFRDCCHTILAFFASGNDADEALSSWKVDVPL
jgi:hypothetical protein